MRPIEYIEAESDNTRIKQHDARGFDALPKSAGVGLLSQALAKKLINISEHHSITLCVLMAQSIAGWCIQNPKVIKPTYYTL